MHRAIVTVLVVLTAAGALAVPSAPSGEDRSAIEKATLDYLEGWYGGDSVRMERALHPELAKRMVGTDPTTGRSFLQPIGASMMVMLAARGAGKLKPGEDAGIEVTILDVHGNMAMVRAKSVRFVDYVQLGRLDGQWRIVNVLWEPATPPLPPPPPSPAPR